MSSGIELGFAFSVGTATFFAPCAVPLLPGYLAYFLGQDDGEEDPTVGARLWRGATVASITSLGLLTVFAVLAGITFTVGASVLRNIAILELVAGVLLIGLGVAMVAGWFSAITPHIQLPERRRGPVGYFSFGAVYAAAAAGCTGPLFLGVVSFALANPVDAIPLLGAYAAGMVSLLVAVTLATALGKDALVRRVTTRSQTVTRVAGGVLVVAGIVQLYFFFVVFDGLAGLSF